MFGLDEQNAITFAPDGEPPGTAAVFASRAELAKVADAKGWSKADVTAVYNANAERVGEKPAKKLRNRPYGLDRIWDLAQRLNGETNGAVKVKTPKAAKPKAPKANKPRKPKGERKPRGASKRDEVVRLLRRENGASCEELQKATGWLPHSVRGFLSTLGSKHGVKIKAEKHETRGRVYKAV